MNLQNNQLTQRRIKKSKNALDKKKVINKCYKYISEFKEYLQQQSNKKQSLKLTKNNKAIHNFKQLIGNITIPRNVAKEINFKKKFEIFQNVQSYINVSSYISDLNIVYNQQRSLQLLKRKVAQEMQKKKLFESLEKLRPRVNAGKHNKLLNIAKQQLTKRLKTNPDFHDYNFKLNLRNNNEIIADENIISHDKIMINWIQNQQKNSNRKQHKFFDNFKSPKITLNLKQALDQLQKLEPQQRQQIIGQIERRCNLKFSIVEAFKNLDDINNQNYFQEYRDHCDKVHNQMKKILRLKFIDVNTKNVFVKKKQKYRNNKEELIRILKKSRQWKNIQLRKQIKDLEKQIKEGFQKISQF